MITATLGDAYIYRPCHDSHVYVITGYIYGDVLKRWKDGTRITTSAVQSIEGDLVHTLNSVYKVENWSEQQNA